MSEASEFLEVWSPSGPNLVALTGDRVTVGKDPSNPVVVAGDRMVSRVHAVLERYDAGWSVRDVGSRNGTYVNGERILTERILRPGDEIRMAKTRIVFRADRSPQTTVTESVVAAPSLTRRERDVLLALCRPVLSGDLFTEPASVREIAESLVLTEPAVKKHLLNLYDKFAIHDDSERRRVRLANEAVRRGAVSIADLR